MAIKTRFVTGEFTVSIVLKEQQVQECLLHVNQYGDVTLTHRLAKWCSSNSGWWSGHQDSLLPLGVKLLQLVKICQLDKLRRLLCLLHNWHTRMFTWCWFRKLFIAWVVFWKMLTVIYVHFTEALSDSVSWLVTNNNNNNNNTDNNNNNDKFKIKKWRRRGTCHYL